MSSVEGRAPRMTIGSSGAAASQGGEPRTSTVGAERTVPKRPAVVSLAGPVPMAAPAPSLSSLLAQARVAGAALADQPLPIANRDLLLVQTLLGG